MEKGYETFVTELRKLLLAAMDLEEDEIYFAKKGEKIWMYRGQAFCGMQTY